MLGLGSGERPTIFAAFCFLLVLVLAAFACFQVGTLRRAIGIICFFHKDVRDLFPFTEPAAMQWNTKELEAC